MSDDPYVYPDSEVLRNCFGIEDADELAAVEADLTAARSLQLLRNPLEGRYDLAHLQRFHKFLFDGIYPWAGEIRTAAGGRPVPQPFSVAHRRTRSGNLDNTTCHSATLCVMILVMSDHFTLRFQTLTTERLERRARLAGAKPRTLATRYVEEGIRHDEHPLIHFVDGATGRRAAVLGTGLDVWEVIATVRDNEGDTAEAAEYLGISRGLVEAAVTYYGEFKDEIDAEIAMNEEESDRAHAAWVAGQQALAT